MPLILNIETSAKTCSVAIAKDGKVISLMENHEGYRHSELLTTLIQQALAKTDISLKQLEAISVSKGPGSYTGLRTGVSTAKGLCYGLRIPLIGIDTLKSMANQYLANTEKRLDKKTLLCPMMDARRMEIYCAIFDIELEVVQATKAEVIDENSFRELLENNKVVFLGDGAEKCKRILSTKRNAIFEEFFITSSSGMAKLSEKAFNEHRFEDVAYFEPDYLKDYVAGKSKKNSF